MSSPTNHSENEYITVQSVEDLITDLVSKSFSKWEPEFKERLRKMDTDLQELTQGMLIFERELSETWSEFRKLEQLKKTNQMKLKTLNTIVKNNTRCSDIGENKRI